MQVSEVVTDDATCISGSYSTTFAMTTGFQLYSSPVVWEWPGSDGVVIAPGDEQTVVFHGLHHQRRFAYQVKQLRHRFRPRFGPILSCGSRDPTHAVGLPFLHSACCTSRAGWLVLADAGWCLSDADWRLQPDAVPDAV